MDKFTIKAKFTIKKATWKSPIVVRLKHLNQSLINSSPVAIKIMLFSFIPQYKFMTEYSHGSPSLVEYTVYIGSVLQATDISFADIQHLTVTLYLCCCFR